MRLGENVPIPQLMRKLKRDHRGYPIPYIVFRDKRGKPQFTVNDGRMVRRCLSHNRCGICGGKMGEIIYFVGGPAAAFHPNGAYVDPPMHKECATYALQVCPFLAFRPYQGAKPTYVLELTNKLPPIETSADLDKPVKFKAKGVQIVENTGVMKGKPEFFVLKGTNGFVNMGDFAHPRMVPTSTEDIEYWKDGRLLDEVADEEFIVQSLERTLGMVDDLNSAVRTPTTGSMQTSLAVLSTLANGET